MEDHIIVMGAYAKARIGVVKSRYHSLSQAEIGGGILRSQQLSGLAARFGVR